MLYVLSDLALEPDHLSLNTIKTLSLVALDLQKVVELIVIVMHKGQIPTS